VISNESHCADLYPRKVTDSEDLRKAKTAVIDQMAEWLSEPNCSLSCGSHGKCVVDICVCNRGWDGAACELEVRTKLSFDVALICAVTVPVLVTVANIYIVWFFIYRKKHSLMSQAMLESGNQ
jgi:hypothetical protein